MLKRIKMLGFAVIAAGMLVACSSNTEMIDIQDTQQVNEMIENQEKANEKWLNNQNAKADPEDDIRAYFDEVKKGVWEANLINYYHMADLENGPCLLTMINDMEGDMSEEEALFMDMFDANWKTFGKVKVDDIEPKNEYECYVTLTIQHQDFKGLLNCYGNVMYYNEDDLIETVMQFKNELALPANTMQSTITITMVNPLLMEQNGIPVDLPEVYDQWLIGESYQLDELLIGDMNFLNY